MGRLVLPALAILLVGFSGCSVSREFENFSAETGQTHSWLSTGSTFDVSYLDELTVNTTRSDLSAWQASDELEQKWQTLLQSYQPAPPVVLEREVVAVPVLFVQTDTRPVVPPPGKTVVEKVEGTDIVIIRQPDGGITVTNIAENRNE